MALLRFDNVTLFHGRMIVTPGLDSFAFRLRLAVACKKVLHFSFGCHHSPELGRRGEDVCERPQKVGQSQLHHNLSANAAQSYSLHSWELTRGFQSENGQPAAKNDLIVLAGRVLCAKVRSY